MKAVLRLFLEDQRGATAIEYGVIALIVGIGIIAGLSGISAGLDGIFNDVGAGFE